GSGKAGGAARDFAAARDPRPSRMRASSMICGIMTRRRRSARRCKRYLADSQASWRRGHRVRSQGVPARSGCTCAGFGETSPGSLSGRLLRPGRKRVEPRENRWYWRSTATEIRLRSQPHGCDARPVDMHPGQLAVASSTVRALVHQQFPRWRGRPIRKVVSEGTVNALYRIGDRLIARFPLQPADARSTRDLLESEARAARELAGRTRFRTPEPVALGEPGFGYPLPRSVQTW